LSLKIIAYIFKLLAESELIFWVCWKVEERLVSVDELLDADEVFCTGTAVVVSPVGSITYQGKR
jgi:branched-subunit amino acid aminotransferase/4-amino-4-deoxychorismate lyase